MTAPWITTRTTPSHPSAPSAPADPAAASAPPAPSRRPAAALAALLLGSGLALFAGCSSGGSEGSAGPHASPASSSTPAASSAAPSAASSAAGGQPDFNPCDGLDATAVSRALGSTVRLETGSTDTPRCALLPARKGGPTFEMSYLWFDQGLEAAWRTMKVPAGAVTRPHVAGADDVRLVVNASRSAYAASAFLQNGSLIQTVNALALPPYDGPRVRRAVQVILAQLSAHAPA